jgi:hypothetical protein
LDAIFYYTDNKLIFESLISQESKLTTADKSLRIMERDTVKISLPNNSTVKLAGILIMSDIETNLLSTQALLTYEIENYQQVHRTEFYREDDNKIIAKESYKEKTSYLT